MDSSSLVQAVQFGDFRIVKEHITARSSPNTVDADGCSLLHWAAINNRVGIALYLIERGADVNIQGGLLHETPLHWAIRKNFYRIVQLLLDHGANTSVKSNLGLDAVHLAVQLESLEMLFVLLSLGADPNTLNQDGDTPLMAVINNHKHHLKMDIIRLLLRMGSDVTIQNPSNGNNALHCICINRQKAALQAAFLIYTSPGAETAATALNHYNNTPWQIVQETRYAGMARFYYDFYVYRYFPSWLPSLAAILSFVSFFPCIEYLGWLWGLAAYAVLHTCLFDKMMEATIESRLSKVNQGSGAAMLLGLVVNHAIFVQQYASTNLTAIFYLLALLTLGLMYKSSTTPATRSRALLTTDRKEVLSRVVASSPSEGPHDSEEVLTAISKQPPIRLCATCLIDKDADTSKHCPTCDVCMNSQLDHHCTFLNNCVGEGNRRVFTGLLLAAVMGCLLAAYMNISVGVSVYCPDKHEKTIEWLFTVQKCLFLEHRSFDMMLLLSMGLVLWTGLQLYGQIIMVAYETTIFEVARDRNVKECMPCSRVCGNLKTFACQGKYKISRREGALEEERALLARGEDSNQSRSHSHHHHSHDHGGHCEHEDEAPLLGGDKRGRFRPGSFDLEMNAPNPIREVQAESMARDRSL